MYIYTHIEYAGTECRDWAGGQAAGGPRASRGSGPRRTWRRAGGRNRAGFFEAFLVFLKPFG